VGWLDRLVELEERKKRLSVTHNTGVRVTRLAVVRGSENQNACGFPTDKRSQKGSYSDALGLVATWSYEFGYISIHDPTTGEWHDLRTEDAPGWAKREAFKRKELYRDGNHKAYRLTAREMEKVWESERVPEPEGIVEDHPIEEEAE
jgi:hypothetical protein